MSTQTNKLKAFFKPLPNTKESVQSEVLIQKLQLQKHPEGGYYKEYYRDAWRVPNPFKSYDTNDSSSDSTRSASTTIFYLLTPANPMGVFHMNKAKTVHTLHKGRGRYVIIHVDEQKDGQKARVETFVVGHNIHDGERLAWVVEGGKYKASFLLPDKEAGSESEGLLISEVSVLYRPISGAMAMSAFF